jgi:hypothetical protein
VAVQEYGGWPFSGEVDILEAVQQQSPLVHALHFGGPWNRCTSITEKIRCVVWQVACHQFGALLLQP